MKTLCKIKYVLNIQYDCGSYFELLMIFGCNSVI